MSQDSNAAQEAAEEAKAAEELQDKIAAANAVSWIYFP